MSDETISVAITGASGAAYGLRLLELLLRAGKRIYMMISAPALVVLETESDLKVPERSEELERFFQDHFRVTPDRLRLFGREEWTAPVASGSATVGPMVICPCSVGTLAAVATGASDTLIERAADVALKERRRLILLVREMPLSAIHLEHMLKLARLGVTIMPASPALYHRPRSVEEMVDFVVARLLDHLGIEQRLIRRWGTDGQD